MKFSMFQGSVFLELKVQEVLKNVPYAVNMKIWSGGFQHEYNADRGAG